MLTMNGKKIGKKFGGEDDPNDMTLNRFPDGTLAIEPDEPYKLGSVEIEWLYEGDEELFALYALTRHMQNLGHVVNLYMPYIPNARMDRPDNGKRVFTLKYFAEIINSLNFGTVTVLDPHSTVSIALIDKLEVIGPKKYLDIVLSKISTSNLLMYYPDEGAMKRYSKLVKMPYAFGVKVRDFMTSTIERYDIEGESVEGKDILIVDDICSKGGTFCYAAKNLKERGARDIYLYVTHCENHILNGDVLKGDLIDKVFTTNSICTAKHERLEVIKL